MTQPSDADVASYLAQVEPAGRREDAILLDRIFREETGFEPVLWGTSIIGYGRYDYTYATGHSGQTLATGFAPRKANMVVYIMPGYGEFAHILNDLGRHKLGKSCLYLGRLSGVNEDALRRLIRAGLEDMATRWPIQPT
ncbi:DUF1801 domain-containing protein [Fluviibacterium sp. S390]|uniref:DUF1801 domain-containing protein n=1 Tax=Fluviibacterium sp. S390 TaxID=3415139 RepID=UPI003C7DD95F